VGGGQCHPGNELQQISFTIPPVMEDSVMMVSSTDPKEKRSPKQENSKKKTERKPGLIDRNFERAMFSLQKTNEAHYLSFKS
jgi:hypothetical protein